MDFANRSPQHVPVSSSHPQSGTPESSDSRTKFKPKKPMLSDSKGWRIILVILLFSIAILLLAIAFSLAFGGNKNESAYVGSKDLQAIDINIAGTSPTNQVYFGHIKDINSQYYVIDDVYFFEASSSSSSSSTNLEPLVCQIDAPFDQMVVNRSSVNWWENLQSSGQVAKTITQYEKDNPKGPTCPSSSTSSSASTSTPATSSTTAKP